jgi:hypothetical protein
MKRKHDDEDFGNEEEAPLILDAETIGKLLENAAEVITFQLTLVFLNSSRSMYWIWCL